jgi:hypothetical protein
VFWTRRNSRNKDRAARGGGARQAAGSLTVMVVPSASEVWHSMDPPSVVAISFAEQAPRPVPPSLPAVANFWKNRSRMPAPASLASSL